MTDILILLQTLRKSLFNIFPDASYVEVSLGATYLTIEVACLVGTKVCHARRRIAWNAFVAHPEPWTLFEKLIGEIRDAYNR